MSTGVTARAREAAYLQHLQRAKSLGVALSEYCSRNDLRAKEWYQVRDVVKKGVMNRTQGSGRQNALRLSATAFVPVRLRPRRQRVRSGTCRAG